MTTSSFLIKNLLYSSYKCSFSSPFAQIYKAQRTTANKNTPTHFPILPNPDLTLSYLFSCFKKGCDVRNTRLQTSSYQKDAIQRQQEANTYPLPSITEKSVRYRFPILRYINLLNQQCRCTAKLETLKQRNFLFLVTSLGEKVKNKQHGTFRF